MRIPCQTLYAYLIGFIKVHILAKCENFRILPPLRNMNTYRCLNHTSTEATISINLLMSTVFLFREHATPVGVLQVSLLMAGVEKLPRYCSGEFVYRLWTSFCNFSFCVSWRYFAIFKPDHLIWNRNFTGFPLHRNWRCWKRICRDKKQKQYLFCKYVLLFRTDYKLPTYGSKLTVSMHVVLSHCYTLVTSFIVHHFNEKCDTFNTVAHTVFCSKMPSFECPCIWYILLSRELLLANGFLIALFAWIFI